MNIAIIYGLDAPADGNGLADYATELKAKLPNARIQTFQQDDLQGLSTFANTLIPGPVVLIGHSFGFDAAMVISSLLQATNRAEVDYLAAIDGVKKGWVPFFWLPWSAWVIPPNVKLAHSFQRTWPWLGIPSSPIRNTSAQWINQPQTAAAHQDMPKADFVKTTIINTIVGLGG